MTEKAFWTEKELMNYLSCSRTKARRIGLAAMARVKIGGMLRYDVEKIKRYIEVNNEG